MDDCKFYMRRVGTADDESQPVMDLERDFPNLYVKEVKGLSTKGEPKNICFESYAEEDGQRVYLPDDVKRKSTSITIVVAVLGQDARCIYDRFYEYVRNGQFEYWDTARKRKARLVLSSEVTLNDDMMKGDTPYLIASLPFTNLWGDTKKLCE